MQKHVINGLVCAFLIVGCGGQKYVKTYEGDLPLNQKPAFVKPIASIVIKVIDGKSVHIAPSSGTTAEYELEFLPGPHSLELEYDSGVQKSTGRLPLNIVVTSGRRYLIKPVAVEGRWHPELADVTDQPQCWTMFVGTLFGPKECGPVLFLPR